MVVRSDKDFRSQFHGLSNVHNIRKMMPITKVFYRGVFVLFSLLLKSSFGGSPAVAQIVADTSIPHLSNVNAPAVDGKESIRRLPVDSTENTADAQIEDSASTVSLDIYEYWVADTSESVSFRLHIRNSSDSVVILDRVEPSCGCILTTIQKSLARKGKDAEVYIALMTSRMNDFQPYTVDVFTSANPTTPLRLHIRKKTKEATEQSR